MVANPVFVANAVSLGMSTTWTARGIHLWDCDSSNENLARLSGCYDGLVGFTAGVTDDQLVSIGSNQTVESQLALPPFD